MPPPKIVGRGTQSKLIITETGKRLYGSNLPYQEQMQKLTGKYVQDMTLVKQSEFKKPYLENSYPEMEHFQYPPGPDPIRPPGPGGFDDDCKVGYEAAGAVKGWQICAPNDDCAGWIFTCAHKIVSFTCGNCQIVRMEQLSGDRLLVIICGKKDNLDVRYKTNDGKTNTVRFGRTCLGTGPDPACVGSGCADCTVAPVIGYTTQQMTTSGGGSTQNLNADGGGGGPYTWSIISGGGTLSKLVTTNNEMTLYTAPATNAYCVNNPTIQVKDYCEHTKTLKLAVSANVGGIAYQSVQFSGINSCLSPPGCPLPGNAITQWVLGCTGINYGSVYCTFGCGCNLYCGGPGRCVIGDSGGGHPCSQPDCTESNLMASCNSAACTCSCSPPAVCDVRSDTQKSIGCCPAGLL